MSHPLDPTGEQLLAQARHDTGIDIDDVDIVERLDRLTASLNSDAKLSEVGANAMQKRLLRILRNRLRMLRDLDAHPEILTQEIRRPIVLSSAPRTGSTKLHKLLCASGDFLYLNGWKGLTLALRSGDRGESPEARIAESDDYAEWFNEHAPGAMAIHEFGSHEPDEESLLFEHCLYAPYLVAFAFIPSYAMWYATTQDFQTDLDFMVRALKYVQWQFHDGDQRRWLLKSPVHLGREQYFAATVPDTVFVTTNRDPYSLMASAASLCKHYQQAHSDVSADQFLGPLMLEGFGTSMEQHLAMRAQHPEINYLDIGYSELTRDAASVTKKVYAHIGETLTTAASNKMRVWDETHQQHTRGMHRYQLEDFGLTRAVVDTKFGNYNAQFGDYF